MSTAHEPRSIVAGVDGSATALQAVAWAAAEAVRRNAPLCLAHSVDYTGIAFGYNLGFSQSFFDAMENSTTAFLAEAERTARAIAPKAEIHSKQLSGPPAATLVELSKEALLTVVGARGTGGFAELLAGSVAIDLAARAHSPVVVVREAEEGGASHADGPVVVGVDGSPSSEEAVAWAFEEASFLGAELVAMHAWAELPSPTIYTYGTEYLADWDDAKNRHEEILAERLAGWQEKYPDVQVRREIVSWSPKDTLVRHSKKAQLVVVGSRGRGELVGALLGSTGRALIHHAHCPVLVVRPHASRKDKA
ncbi:MAG: universal stress protein [Segniliparus sp.]|uniref:universal stress protein n=1 Tax=Segniliparus sp. TaxID=2804064 RepID=UPI003F35B183